MPSIDAELMASATKKTLRISRRFLKQLNDVNDKDFRNYILKSKILDTSGDIE